MRDEVGRCSEETMAVARLAQMGDSVGVTFGRLQGHRAFRRKGTARVKRGQKKQNNRVCAQPEGSRFFFFSSVSSVLMCRLASSTKQKRSRRAHCDPSDATRSENSFICRKV